MREGISAVLQHTVCDNFFQDANSAKSFSQLAIICLKEVKKSLSSLITNNIKNAKNKLYSLV